ncbi:Rab-GTPase-TBC domain containing protein [Trema orientale]|uniref:Rab-GTPase-TBC domain containing protein n=1 Tax=Trema orientale TaxID=63057 RepID=A0A2P5ETY7_TREOI|nr:Rab-GTPase-TBC domain containing protein [Trema orientale]
MLAGKKLKFPEKARKAFPDRLGSLVAGFDDKEEEEQELRGFDSVVESGEELETFGPNDGFGSGIETGNDGSEGLGDEAVNVSGFRVRMKPDRESAGSVSVLEAIAADEKRSDLEYELSQPEINLEKLQRVAGTGLPDGGSLRATTWKLLLGYLPPSRELWEKELKENRAKYAKLKEELLLSPTNQNHESRQSEFTRRNGGELSSNDLPVEIDVDGPLQRHEISEEDHPLSLGKSSAWHRYFEHTEITEQVDRDLQRTHPDMKFFSGDSSSSKKKREAMRNILLLFSKLNPAIRYVQGMNEVLAPIFYVFSTDTNEQNAANAEADSFSCFVRLMSDSVDHFCQQLDNSSVGILSTLSRLTELLKANDEELWRHLELTTKVDHIAPYSGIQFPIHYENMGFSLE